MSTPASLPVGVYPRFTVSVAIPLAPEYLAEILRVAVECTGGLSLWATIHGTETPNVYMLREKEWEWNADADPETEAEPLRIDLHTIQRGLQYYFDVRQDIPLPERRLVMESLFYYQATPAMAGLRFEQEPGICSALIQRALFGQVIYG